MLKACVIGWPIKHSRSPLIHNFWLQQYGLSGSYEKVAIEPSNLEIFISTVGQNSFVGCNVTIPHKEQVASFVTVQDPLTQKIGAVNTVYVENNIVYGLNTDGYGFISNLKQSHEKIDFNNNHCVVIGAGGASRAIIAALLEQKVAKISLVNRTIGKAKKLADHFGEKVIPVIFNDLQSVLKTADLLVNTTSLGMTGQPELDIDLTDLPTSCVVSDIVYVPLKTKLLKQAEQQGNVVIDGLGMLLHQAAPGFKKWFGVFPEVTPQLRALIVADLEKV